MAQTTTTTTTTVTTTVSLNTSYLMPQGILKIIEIIVCIIVFALVADQGFVIGAPAFALAVGVIFFLTTLILLIFFLFNLTAQLGGNKIWFIIDTVLNVLAVVLFFIAAIILFVYCTYTILGRTYVFDKIVAAGVFAIIAMILYILSIVFAVKAGQAPMISIKA